MRGASTVKHDSNLRKAAKLALWGVDLSDVSDEELARRTRIVARVASQAGVTAEQFVDRLRNTLGFVHRTRPG